MKPIGPAPSATRTEQLRALIRQRLRTRAESLLPPDPPPRYDEIFFRGQQWLDELAANPDPFEW